VRYTLNHKKPSALSSDTCVEDQVYHRRRRSKEKRNQKKGSSLIYHGMDPSLLPSEVEWRKLSIVACPKGNLVGHLDRPLRCWLVKVVHWRGLGDLICLSGEDLVWPCRWNLVGRGKVPRVRTNMESKVALVSFYLLVPLPKDSTRKKEVIRRIRSDLIGG
jgi:hypothetical protein